MVCPFIMLVKNINKSTKFGVSTKSSSINFPQRALFNKMSLQSFLYFSGILNVRTYINKLSDPYMTYLKYYLINEQECFIGFKTRGEAERFISDKARTASFLNGFKNVSVRSPHWRSNSENRQRLN